MTDITIHVKPNGFFLSYNGEERPIMEVDPRTPTSFRDWQVMVGTSFGAVAALLPAGTPVGIQIESLILVAGASGTAAIIPAVAPAP